MILPRAFTYLNPALAPTVLVALKPIMSWRELNYKLNLAATSRPSYKARSLVTCVVMRECATNDRVVCNWVDLLQVSSVQFMCCEHILTASSKQNKLLQYWQRKVASLPRTEYCCRAFPALYTIRPHGSGDIVYILYSIYFTRCGHLWKKIFRPLSVAYLTSVSCPNVSLHAALFL